MPDSSHSDAVDASPGMVEIELVLGARVTAFREWSGEGGGSPWLSLPLPIISSAVGSSQQVNRTVRVAVGGGEARFYQAITV